MKGKRNFLNYLLKTKSFFRQPVYKIHRYWMDLLDIYIGYIIQLNK